MKRLTPEEARWVHELGKLVRSTPKRLHVQVDGTVHVAIDEPENPCFTHERGRVDQDLVVMSYTPNGGTWDGGCWW